MKRREFITRFGRTGALALSGLIAVPGSLCAEPPQTVEIITKSGIRALTVEVAVGDQQTRKGLSGRKELPAGHGMLFDLGGEMQATFNTEKMLFPIDIIFIRSDGRIHSIAQNAEPQLSRQIVSNGVVRGVLELVGGSCKLLGIGVSDRVVHPLFRTR